LRFLSTLFFVLISGVSISFAQDAIDDFFDVLSEFDLYQVNYTWFNDSEIDNLQDYSSIYFQANAREFNDFALGTEFIVGGYGYNYGKTEVSYFEVIAALGPYWNIKFSDDPWLIPYIGGTVGMGYAYRAESVGNYLDTYDEQTSADLDADGLLFYYNGVLGVDIMTSGVGVNISMNYGYHNRISAGLTFGF